MVSDTDIQQERIRQERRRRGEGDVTEDLIWAGAFDPYTAPVTPTSYGDTGLTVTTGTPATLDRSRTESLVNISPDTSSMTGNTSLASTLPVGAVDDSSLTASVRGGRAIVEPQSDNETYNLWSQTEYYSEHFRPEEEGGTELGNIEESLENNAAFKASWVEASRQVYEMHYGREISSSWSDERIAEWGLDYMREFNGALVTLDVEALGLHGGMTNIAMKVRGGTDAQKQAFGYLMDSLDEADLSTSGALSFAGNMLVDPTTYLGLGTFGAGTAAAQGAKVAARQGVKQVVRHTMREGLRRGFATTIREGAEAAIRAPLRSRITTAALIAGSEGAVYGLASDANMQSVNISMGRQESYSLSQAGLSASIGFAAGGILGGGMTGAAPYIGRGTAAVIRPIENRVIRPTASFLRNSASRLSDVTPNFRRSATPDAAATRVAEDVTARTTREASEDATTRTTRATSEQTTGRTTTEGPNGRVDGNMDGPFTPGDRTTFASASAKRFFNRGVPSSATTPSGIAIPDYRQGINWMTYWVKRSWNPYKLFTKWTNANPKSAPVDATPVLRPLIDSFDQSMKKHGLVDALRTLQRDMNGFAQQLKTNPDNKTAILQAIDDRLATFSTDHQTALKAFETDVNAIRTHVKNTYVTEAEYRAMHNLPKDKPLPKGVQVIMSESDGRKTGLIHRTDENGNVIFSHRDTILNWLSDMRGVSQNLRRPDFGSEGARIRNLSNISDPLKAATEISNSLNKLEEIAVGAHKRLDPKGHLWQEVEILERTLQEGYYNSYSRRGKVGDTNIEHPWQILEDQYKQFMNDKGEVDWGVNPASGFASSLVDNFYKNGLDHEAVYLIHYLRLKRGNGGLDTYPKNLPDLLRSNKAYNYETDAHFRNWVDKIAETADLTHVPGHVMHPFAHGRAAEKYYAEAGYFYRFARRYRGKEGPQFTRGLVAKPAKITALREGILHPLGRAGYFFLGAAETVAKEGRKDEYFRLSAKWWGEKDNWWRNPVTRSALRLSTGGLLTKPGLYTAGAGLGMYGVGHGINYAFGEDGEGTFVGDGLTTIGRLPANIGLGTANFIADQTWGRLPYMPDMPYDTALYYLNSEDLSEADVREALQDVVFDDATPFSALPPAQQDAIVRQLAEEDNAVISPSGLYNDEIVPESEDLSERHINEVYRNVISSSGGNTTTRSNGGNGTTTRPNGGDGTTTTTQNGGDGTTTTQNSDSTRTRTYTRRQESGWESAGNVVSNVGNAAFGWLGEGTTSSIGNMLSSSANWIGGFFNKLASGQVRNGEKWLAGGMGLLAALVGGPMITKALGMEGVPFVGLIIAGLIFGFGGGLAHDYMTGQGSGNHRPNRARRTQQDHDGATTTQAPETPETPQTQVLATDNPGDPEYAWDAIRASDSDTNGKFAVQMSMDPNKESFVDLRVLNPTEVAAMGANAQDIVNQAIAEGRFISNDRLAGMQLDSFDKWEFTAVETGTVPRPDNEVLVFAKPDNSNDYVVLELDQPN